MCKKEAIERPTEEKPAKPTRIRKEWRPKPVDLVSTYANQVYGRDHVVALRKYMADALLIIVFEKF